MESLEQILENARALYQQRAAQDMAANNARQAEKEKQIDRERAELREWLVQFIPSGLMQYVDTSEYNHSAASRLPFWLQVSVPGAAPIGFSVRRLSSAFYGIGSSGEFTDYPVFRTPSSGGVRVDDDGIPYIFYRFDDFSSPDFQLALGASADFWRELGEAIESALEQKAAECRIAGAAVPVTRENLSLDERQVLALEAIAAALETMAYNAS